MQTREEKTPSCTARIFSKMGAAGKKFKSHSVYYLASASAWALDFSDVIWTLPGVFLGYNWFSPGVFKVPSGTSAADWPLTSKLAVGAMMASGPLLSLIKYKITQPRKRSEEEAVAPEYICNIIPKLTPAQTEAISKFTNTTLVNICFIIEIDFCFRPLIRETNTSVTAHDGGVALGVALGASALRMGLLFLANKFAPKQTYATISPASTSTSSPSPSPSVPSRDKPCEEIKFTVISIEQHSSSLEPPEVVLVDTAENKSKSTKGVQESQISLALFPQPLVQSHSHPHHSSVRSNVWSRQFSLSPIGLQRSASLPLLRESHSGMRR